MTDKASLFYQILEDVYNASSLCRPDIDHVHESNEYRYGPTSTHSNRNKNDPLQIEGIAAPNTLKNYHIPSHHNKQRITAYRSKDMVNKQKKHRNTKRKRPSTARPPNFRLRKFYKDSNHIRIKRKRIRPKSAPLKRSQTISNIHQTTKLYNNTTKSINYHSTSNLIFRSNNKFQTFNTTQSNRNNLRNKNHHHSSNNSYSTQFVEQNKNARNDILSTSQQSEWIAQYIKDKKQLNSCSLDKFAQMKIMDLYRRYSHKTVSKDEEFNSVIPDVDDEDDH
eukprot:966500_1